MSIDLGDGFDGITDDEFVDYDVACVMLVQAIKAYLPWLCDFAFGERDPETGDFVTLPIEAARQEHDFLAELCKSLEDVKKLPADMEQRLHPAPRAKQ